MKFARTPQFYSDWGQLSDSDKECVKMNFASVAEALQGDSEKYTRHKIKKMEGFQDIWEGHIRQNLCFTFHYSQDKEGEKICFFRRIGTHKIYKMP